MHFFSRYSYIWSFPKEQEKEYNQFVLGSNLVALKTMSLLTLAGMTAFIIVDYFRHVDFQVVLLGRSLAMIVAIGIFYRASKGKLGSSGIQFSVSLLAVSILCTAFITAYYAGMPSFYLTNVVFLLTVLISTASGLYFRNGLYLNLSIVVMFVLYATFINVNPFYISQYPHIFAIFIYMQVVAIMLERRRKLHFLQFQNLKEQKKVVDELNSQKAKIISILSHDIASPIHSLLGIVDLDKKGLIRADDVRPLMNRVGEELSRVHTLMYSLMRWSKSQMEGFSVTPVAFDMNDLVQENIELFQSKLTQKELTVGLQNADPMWVKADVEMIRLVMRNLISNAIKFSVPGTEIIIGITQTNDSVKVSISNDGPQLSQDALHNLFGFEMTSTPGTLNEKGAGLGLALAYHFISLNHGKITLEPYTTCAMTTFVIELPMAQAPGIKPALDIAKAKA